MPIEAQVRPLPSELTTPPVTKMCLVCLAVEEGKVFPSWRETCHGRGQARPHRIYTIGRSMPPSGGPAGLEEVVDRDESLIIVIRVHPQRRLVDQADPD